MCLKANTCNLLCLANRPDLSRFLKWFVVTKNTVKVDNGQRVLRPKPKRTGNSLGEIKVQCKTQHSPLQYVLKSITQQMPRIASILKISYSGTRNSCNKTYMLIVSFNK